MHLSHPSRTRALAALLLTAVLALAGCTSSGDDGDSKSDYGAGSQQDAGGAADNGRGSGKSGAGSGTSSSAKKQPPKLTGVHVVRTASLSVRVKDVPDAVGKARTAAEDAGGMVGNETTDRDSHGHERSRLTLRVPQDAYEDVLDELSGSGRLLRRAESAKDVTDQVVDVNSRIATQRASVARVRELMDRAARLSDVVTLEGELSNRQSELEALLAQQASLKDRTTLATITMTLSETPAKAVGDDDGPGFLDALAGGWSAFVTALRWVVIAVAAVLPFAAVAAVLLWVWLRVLRPRRPRREVLAPVHGTQDGPGQPT
ncbi:DUF4349 domain-containing protein [Streptomyces sp. NPDC016845]|uniref:DUF4349 domain-containing protein n=1 Tax=Streptomyces sp. NPDC016845 TaxID=3364972 RepID=UPI00379B6E61